MVPKNNIKFYRSDKFLSRKELSKLTDISVRRLQNIENGEIASTKQMLMLSNVLYKPVSELFPNLSFRENKKFEEEKKYLNVVAELETKLLTVEYHHNEAIKRQKNITQKVKSESIGKISRLKAKLTENEVGVLFRELKFPPSYQQAGMTIIQGFVELIKNKYTDKEFLITIEQEEHKVIMKIRDPDGETKEIEEDLRKFSLIIVGKEEISSITDDKIEVLKLQNQLSIASLQVQQQRDINNLLLNEHEKRIGSLEEQNQWLREHLSHSLKSSPNSINLAFETIREHTELFKIVTKIKTEVTKEKKDQGFINKLIMTASEVIAKDGIGAGVAEATKKVIQWATKNIET